MIRLITKVTKHFKIHKYPSSHPNIYIFKSNETPTNHITQSRHNHIATFPKGLRPTNKPPFARIRSGSETSEIQKPIIFPRRRLAFLYHPVHWQKPPHVLIPCEKNRRSDQSAAHLLFSARTFLRTMIISPLFL